MCLSFVHQNPSTADLPQTSSFTKLEGKREMEDLRRSLGALPLFLVSSRPRKGGDIIKIIKREEDGPTRILLFKIKKETIYARSLLRPKPRPPPSRRPPPSNRGLKSPEGPRDLFLS